MKLDSTIAALVTGGASGLGEATARHLASFGVRVTLLDLNAERGNRVAGEIGGFFQMCDVTSDDSVDAALAAARARHGVERILVNCAGIVAGQRTVSKDRETGALKAHDLGAFTKVVAINLIGSYRMIAKSSVAMAGLEPVTPDGGRGVIVNTSSVAAEDGQIGQAAYSASKGGVLALTLPVARDLSGHGIRVVSILPGIFHTPMFDQISEEYRKTLAAAVPFPQRLGNPAEYAALVESICRNDMLNGTSIRLDGAIRMAPK
ncbi:MAG: SDR family NAD(P)-dependent oxidoreductase [Methylobacterium sp.]|jgi:NAD(P)-dependent dehydrogenase (short-subunit alcohol dehydrogenase family)|nr:SDR family NAD(P)-dependent oxidoreductase [Methylobacterium sp.]MCA3603094.1 SDR family NAD(P)-dependent oxidoreductase [Methylobacterium sp.]MCA3614542.1 SDR family NAD(P)-dependent oxidoreductase [Methylobacterium sp.]MCA3622884.1 SDR family NAD(P)-dependent oxidoreductase [Methylobacterium sp.]MCA4909504.1 SDR family NAD(P)-dependent oxidoreductase [Methylobacterium sp.]